MLCISGSKWSGLVVQWNTDSDASEAIYFKTRSRNRRINRLIKLISAFCHARAIIIYPVWRSRDRNVLADSLSKGDIPLFLSQLPAGLGDLSRRQKVPPRRRKKKVGPVPINIKATAPEHPRFPSTNCDTAQTESMKSSH